MKIGLGKHKGDHYGDDGRVDKVAETSSSVHRSDASVTTQASGMLGESTPTVDGRPQRVTIRDVAEAAGVSVSTVSHVLNEYGDISPDTDRHVRQIMKQMNYHPSSLARRLTRSRSFLFQLLLFSVEGLHHPFFYEVTCGITEEVEQAGYELLLSVKASEDGRWRDSLKRCYESKVEGLIIMGTLPGPEVFEEIEASQIPTVFIDLTYQGARSTYVTSDNVGGAMLATEHLISLGHRRIGFLDGHDLHQELLLQDSPSIDVDMMETTSPTWGISQTRLAGYQRALHVHDIPFDPDLIGYGDFTQAGAKDAVAHMLTEHPDITAIFAISDIMAFGAMQAVRALGRRVASDVAVVGYDDIQAASFVRPALSTIRQDGEEMGKSAVREILRLIENPGAMPQKVILPVELVVRESCGAM